MIEQWISQLIRVRRQRRERAQIEMARAKSAEMAEREALRLITERREAAAADMVRLAADVRPRADDPRAAEEFRLARRIRETLRREDEALADRAELHDRQLAVASDVLGRARKELAAVLRREEGITRLGNDLRRSQRLAADRREEAGILEMLEGRWRP